MPDTPIIRVEENTLGLNFQRAEFTHTVIRGLVASPRRTTVEHLSVEPWSESEISNYHQGVKRWKRWGHHLRALILRVGRSLYGDGLVQRGARRLNVPLSCPSSRTCSVIGAHLQGGHVGVAFCMTDA